MNYLNVPFKVIKAMILGEPDRIRLNICEGCGAAVKDMAVHDAFHERVDA